MVLEPDRNAGLKRVVALEFHHDKSTVKFDRFKNVILSAGESLQDEKQLRYEPDQVPSRRHKFWSSLE